MKKKKDKRLLAGVKKIIWWRTKIDDFFKKLISFGPKYKSNIKNSSWAQKQMLFVKKSSRKQKNLFLTKAECNFLLRKWTALVKIKDSWFLIKS